MIQTPVNQVRLTNVAIVRYKIMGQRFEVACYKNKVQDYRDGVEEDLNEVLQIYQIFTNVSKGEVANKKTVKKYLKAGEDEAIKIILTKGELQISELERESEFESLKLSIANIVSRMCVNKENSVPFPVPIVLKAMDDIKFHVKEGHNAKKQALALIKELPAVLPLERAKMKIKFSCTNEEKVSVVKSWMTETYDKQESEEEGNLYLLQEENKTELTYLIMPWLIRDVTNFCNKDDDVSFEIVEHYVYSRLLSASEEEEAKKVYEEAQKKREDEANSTQTFIVSSNFEEDKIAEPKKGKFSCSTCLDVQFKNNKEFKEHFKSEWHVENTKRKMEDQPKLNEADYLIFKEDEIDREMFMKDKKGRKGKKKKGRKNRDY